MTSEYTYISLLYRNKSKITERIINDMKLFKEMSIGKSHQLFKQENGTINITLDDVIFATISSITSSLKMGDLSLDRSISTEPDDENNRKIDIELLFDNGAIETIKCVNYTKDFDAWSPKVDNHIKLLNTNKEIFYFNTKNLIYIKYIESSKNRQISSQLG